MVDRVRGPQSLQARFLMAGWDSLDGICAWRLETTYHLLSCWGSPCPLWNGTGGTLPGLAHELFPVLLQVEHKLCMEVGI